MRKANQNETGEEVKIKIVKDELYPAFFIEDFGVEVEVENSKVAEWKRVMEDFDRVQNEMQQAAFPF